MAEYLVREKRIKQPGHPQEFLCGDCGTEVIPGVTLCYDCLVETMTRLGIYTKQIQKIQKLRRAS